MELPIALKTELVSEYSSCPAQWNGETVDGKFVYVRYRWGVLSVSVDDERVWKKTVGDNLDGTMFDDEMKEHLFPSVLVVQP